MLSLHGSSATRTMTVYVGYLPRKIAKAMMPATYPTVSSIMLTKCVELSHGPSRLSYCSVNDGRDRHSTTTKAQPWTTPQDQVYAADHRMRPWTIGIDYVVLCRSIAASLLVEAPASFHSQAILRINNKAGNATSKLQNGASCKESHGSTTYRAVSYLRLGPLGRTAVDPIRTLVVATSALLAPYLVFDSRVRHACVRAGNG